MKKPEKREEKEVIISGSGKKHLLYNPNAIGYNQAINDYEAFLPDDMEILKVISDEMQRILKTGKRYRWLDIAKAISKRLKGEK